MYSNRLPCSIVAGSVGFLVLQLAALSGCSLMAIGPPASPPILYLNSTAGQTNFIKSEFLDYNLKFDEEISEKNYTSIDFRGESEDLQTAPYWFLVDKKFKNKQPFSGSLDYPVVRNVKDYGAKGDGINDDWANIMFAMTQSNRCGEHCSASSTKGAIIYFPPGKYKISRPIIQYYFTIIVGDPIRRPIIIGSKNFKGMALIDTDVYYPGGSSWWINTNNFYRQIRNLILDMTDMPNSVPDSADGVPNGIHWQVSQACTLQNIHIIMPVDFGTNKVTHRGIFMENGSGGFVSDISFVGGKVGFVAGNQQYTARNLRFTRCETAIEMLWDWGFTWKNISFIDTGIGIDAHKSGMDSNTGRVQGVGSMTVLDSTFHNVKQGIIVGNAEGYVANVVLDNVHFEGNSGPAISDSTGAILMGSGPRKVNSWAMGRRYTDQYPSGTVVSGDLIAPFKQSDLLTADGKFVEREKPQYLNVPASDFVNVLEFGARNDGIYPNNNVASINFALLYAASKGKIGLFPAGVYKVDDTIRVPIDSKIVGILYPQLMAVGPKFADASNPRVFVRVANPGDKGIIEISDLILTNQGATAGAVFMEWNAYQTTQASAAMWDVIIRVGGAAGTNLLENSCHQYGKQAIENCMASSMMLHVTREASIYLENSWFWVADHDIESRDQTRINVYGGRGVLIESTGPSWIHSVSNEHSTLYNWQLSGARNLYLGHIQSETPYFQAGQLESTLPYVPSTDFVDDPTFPDCSKSKSSILDTCRESWALRIIRSSDIYLYGGGFYSFFQNYEESCAKYGRVCQDKLIDTDYSERLWLYNLFTVGSKEVISPQGFAAVNRESEINGFATATSAWLKLSLTGSMLGGTRVSTLYSDEDEDTDDFSPPCKRDLNISKMDQLESSLDMVPGYCAGLHAVQMFSRMTVNAVGLVKNDDHEYDDLFGYYREFMADWVNKKLGEFMNWEKGEGVKYFTCSFDDSSGDKPIVHQCPIPNLRLTLYPIFHLRYQLDDEKGFFDAIHQTYGIQKDWVEFKTVTTSSPDHGGRGKNDTERIYQARYGVPKAKEDLNVPNPRDQVKKAIATINDLQSKFDSTVSAMTRGLWQGSSSDVAQVMSVPALLLQQAVEAMDEVKKIGKDMKHKEKTGRILEVLGIVFAIVPFLGQIGAELSSFTVLSRMFFGLGLTANLALGTASAVLDPQMAPFAILGTLLSTMPMGMSTPKQYRKMAEVRSKIRPEEFGTKFKENDAHLQRIISTCKR